MAGTIAILAEKPSQMRNFAAALGADKNGNGTYNGERYVLVASRGHIYNYVDPEDMVEARLYSRYHDWALENLPWDERDFSWKRARRDSVADVAKTIKEAFASADEICIATDNDPTGEGELIAWEIIDELGFAHGKNKRFSRMFFEDESAAEVRRAFENRVTIASMETDMDFVKAQYRCRWDKLSMQFTRAATRISGVHGTFIRQGRLKSVMVRLVGDQLDAVGAYKKVPSYSNRFRDENGCVYTSPDEPTYPRREQVPQGAYKRAHVVVDSKTRKSTPPQRLMDLARLSAILAGRGISADRTIKAYQELYEAGILSYPRTEDKCITIEQFNEALPNVDAIAALVGVDASVLTHREPRPTHVKAGMAHGANRPGKKVPASLASLRAGYGDIAVEIYTILAKNFLAMFAEDYVYEQQKGHLQEYPGFKGSANVPVSLGWKQVSSDASDDDLDTSNAGLGTIADPFVHEGFPPRPATPTMKWLMNQLEKHDVGTGATRANTYADVISSKTKGQLMREGKGGRIELTQEGKISHMLLPGTHIGDVAMTEQLMREMRDVAAGKLDPDEALSRVKGYVTDDIETMKANAPKMRETLGVTMENERERVSGEWMGEKVSFNRDFGGHRFTDEEVEALLAGKPITFEATSKRTNSTYTAVGTLARQSYNGHDYVGFKLDFDLVERDVPASWCEHTFTAQEKRDLKAGRAVHIDAAVSKKGKVFSCDVTWEEQDDGRMGITPSFASGGIPASWCEHTFTPAEKAELEAGNPVHVDDAVSKRTGKKFECDLTYKRREDGSMGIVPSFGRR